MIRWTCRQCGEGLEVPDSLSRESLECPQCGVFNRPPEEQRSDIQAAPEGEFQVPVIDARDESKLIIAVPGNDLDDAKRNALAAGWALQDDAPPPADPKTKRSVFDQIAGDDPTERAVFFGNIRSAAVVGAVVIVLALVVWGIFYMAGADERERAAQREYDRFLKQVEELGGG